MQTDSSNAHSIDPDTPIKNELKSIPYSKYIYTTCYSNKIKGSRAIQNP